MAEVADHDGSPGMVASRAREPKCDRMTRSGTAPRSPLYGSGPWLIVNGDGVLSDRTAAIITQQCDERQVERVRVAIDDVHSSIRDLIWFLGLVLVLPDAHVVDGQVINGRRLGETLAPYRTLTREYRSRRSAGVRDAVLGRKPWYAVGALQLVGVNAVLRAPALRTVRGQCCDQHALERHPEPDVFRVYSRLPEPVTRPNGFGEHVERRLIDEAVLRIRGWGISAPEAPALLDLINECRNDYERLDRPAMYRPVAGVRLNRLDLMLDGRLEEHQADDVTWSRLIGDSKSWTENNATIWREVEATIVSHVPTFHFPSTGHKKGAVEAFHRFYQDLVVIDPYYRSALHPASEAHDRQILP